MVDVLFCVSTARNNTLTDDFDSGAIALKQECMKVVLDSI